MTDYEIQLEAEKRYDTWRATQNRVNLIKEKLDTDYLTPTEVNSHLY